MKCSDNLLSFLFLMPALFWMPDAVAQPSLTGVITFEALQKKSVERVLSWTLADGSTEEMTITEMAIPTGPRILQLTKDFMLLNYHRESIWVEPKVIVFHSMDLGDLKSSLEKSSFLHNEMPAAWGALSKAGQLPNGAHFIIERDGHVICLTPPLLAEGEISYNKDNHHWLVRRHQDGNPFAIGIENTTERNGSFEDLTPQQIEANAKLARWLIWMESGKIQSLTSHHQYNSDHFADSLLHNFSSHHYHPEWRTRERSDIGDENLHQIIEMVFQKGFQASPR